MKRIGIREFRDHATRYLAGSEVLAIERHGRPIGFYVPAAASSQETIAHALHRLQQTVERVRAEAGLSEEELSRLYDVSAPLPDPSPLPDQERQAESHAARR